MHQVTFPMLSQLPSVLKLFYFQLDSLLTNEMRKLKEENELVSPLKHFLLVFNSFSIFMGTDMQLGSRETSKEPDYNNVVRPYSKLQMANI